MCTSRPCKCSVDCFRVADIEQMFTGEGTVRTRPGAFRFGQVRDADVVHTQCWVSLPCEGGELHGLPVVRAGQPTPSGLKRPFWAWDGNEEEPTLTPSILTWRKKDQDKPDTPENRQEVWHGYLTAGRLVSC